MKTINFRVYRTDFLANKASLVCGYSFVTDLSDCRHPQTRDTEDLIQYPPWVAISDESCVNDLEPSVLYYYPAAPDMQRKKGRTGFGNQWFFPANNIRKYIPENTYFHFSASEYPANM